MTQPNPSTDSDIASALDVNAILRGYVGYADRLRLRVDGFRPTAKRQRRRRARLKSALREAEKAGRVVTSATVEGDKISLTFDEPKAAASDLDQWLAKRAKHARQT